MNEKELNIIHDILNEYDEIIFALLFGSRVDNKISSKSDIDIGIFTDGTLDLLKKGKIITDIENIAKQKVDLVELNEIYRKSPLLAYKVATNHKVIIEKNENLLTDFKTNSFKHYFDSIKLRETVRAAFLKRIADNKFGHRNYG